MPTKVTLIRQLEEATTALKWISDNEADEDALQEKAKCDNAYHITHPNGDERCPQCYSHWWDLNEGVEGRIFEGDYVLGAVAAKALSQIEQLEEDELARTTSDHVR